MNYPLLGRKLAVGIVLTLTAAACGSSISETSVTETTATETESSGTEVNSDLATPTIDIAIGQDAKAGQNLTVDLSNFDISPEAASTEAVDGQGHLHLYINGERTLRFYNEALHLDLEPGSHEVMVELNSNDHSAWTLDGEAIVAMTSIDVPESTEAEPDHSQTDDQDTAGFESQPTAEIMVMKDPKSGWNVHAPVESFTLSAENASGDPVDGEGHLHLLIDGQKAERLYGSWWHIAELDEGEHEVSVELRANDHAALTLNGEIISASTNVTVSAEEADDTAHGHDEDHSMDEEEHDDHGESSGSEAVEDGLSAADAESEIKFVLSDGNVEATLDGEPVDGGIDIESGTVVSISITSDVEDEVHLHGHDILVDVAPEADGTIVFTADIAGSLEVEMEGSGTLLANLRVS